MHTRGAVFTLPASNASDQECVCPRLRTILEIEQTRDPLISYRKITWNPLISFEKILAFFSAEIMGSPNILLGIPLIKKNNRENHNIWTQRRGLGKFVLWKRGFGILWFVLKMSEPAQVMSTWTFKWKGGLGPRFCFKCFAPCCKITKKTFVRSDFIKTLQHYGFLMKLSAW